MAKVSAVWGFDPTDLLQRAHFPNDESEYKVRHIRSFRIQAIRSIYEKAEESQVKRGKLYIAAPGLQVADEPLSQEELVRQKTSKIQQEQLARSAAAIIIQTCFRGWATRKRYVLIITALLSIKTHRDGVLSDALLPGVKDFKLQDKLRKKFSKYCSYFDKRNLLPPDYPQFCASLLQAQWKRYTVLQAYNRLREKRVVKNGEEAVAVSQRDRIEFLNLVAPKEKKNFDHRDKAALKIQKIWKKYYNSRVYLFYRDLIKIREKGDPFEMLKYINPRESKIIDRSQGLHIRFRLGGDTFPPVILYKIFIHKSLIDMNAFSPRNYTSNETKIQLPQVTFLNTQEPLEKKPSDEWYERIDSNDWRPVLDPAFQFSPNAIVHEKKHYSPYHYSKLNRQQDIEMKRKQRKLAWIKKLYELGEKTNAKDKWVDVNKGLSVSTSPAPRKMNPDQEIEKFMNELEVLELNQSLLTWTNALNFEDYHSSWLTLATTCPSNQNSLQEIDEEEDHIRRIHEDEKVLLYLEV